MHFPKTNVNYTIALFCLSLLTQNHTYALIMNKIAWTRAERSLLGFQYDILFLRDTDTNFANSNNFPMIRDRDDIGFQIGLGSFFQGRCLLGKINWFHYLSHTGLCPFNPHANGENNLKIDTVDLNLGKVIFFKECFLMNFFAGIEYAQIKQNINVSYKEFKLDICRDFKGAGPQFGFDFCYNIGRGFQLTGQSSLSLMGGSAKNQETLKPLCKKMKSGEFIPAFKERLGIAYGKTFRERYTFFVELGFQANCYLNALHSGSLMLYPDKETYKVKDSKWHNFVVTWPYLSFSLLFN